MYLLGAATLLLAPPAVRAQGAGAAPLVPLLAGAEWAYASVSSDHLANEAEEPPVTFRVTGTKTVGGDEWFAVEETSGDGGEPTVWFWRNAPEGFYEFYGDDLSKETRGAAVLYRFPIGEGETYRALTQFDSDFGLLEAHTKGFTVGGRAVEAVCYARPDGQYGWMDWDGEYSLFEGDCFVPGVGRVLHRHEFGEDSLVTGEGTYTLDAPNER